MSVPQRGPGRCGEAPARGRWQGWQESNLRHPVLETGALASELHPFEYHQLGTCGDPAAREFHRKGERPSPCPYPRRECRSPDGH